jgi:hypothetical protein
MMPEKGAVFPNFSITLKGGYEFDDVFARKWKVDNSWAPNCGISNFSSRDQLGIITLNLADRVEIYGGVGSLFMRFTQNINELKIHYRTDTHFAWDIGGRFLLAYWGDLQCGLTAAYLFSNPLLDSIRLADTSIASERGKAHYTEWQVGASLSYRLSFFYPYIGSKYAIARAKLYSLGGLDSFFPHDKFVIKNIKMPGLVLGCGFAPERGFSINIEGRFIDETALSVTADIRF